MPITAQRILTELGRRAWSGFNADDMISIMMIVYRLELNLMQHLDILLTSLIFRLEQRNKILKHL